ATRASSSAMSIAPPASMRTALSWTDGCLSQVFSWLFAVAMILQLMRTRRACAAGAPARQIRQPIGVKPPRRLAPGLAQPHRRSAGERAEQLRVAARQGAVAVRVQHRLARHVEIMLRQNRVVDPLAGQKAGDVAPVFAVERSRVVFRMAL